MFRKLRHYLSLKEQDRRLAWKALMKFFDRCDIRESLRPSLLYVNRETYERWERAGCPSRHGATVALKYVRLYKALHALCGDDRAIVHWLNTPNYYVSPSVPVLWLIVHGETKLDDVVRGAEAEVFGK